MSWLVDHAGFVYFLLGLVAFGFLVAYRIQRRNRQLGYAAGVVVIIGLFWLLTRLVVSDAQKIHVALQQMADATVAQDPDKLFSYVARDFKYNELTRDDVYSFVKRSIQNHQVKNIHIWGYEPVAIDRAQGTAKVRFKATLQAPDGERPFGVIADFRFEEATWKMQCFQLFSNFTNFEQPIDLPMR